MDSIAKVAELDKTSAPFNQFLRLQYASPDLNKLMLPDLLIMPVQRITRYELLLSRLDKALKDAKDPNADNIAHAYTLIQSLNKDVNEYKAKIDKAKRVWDVQKQFPLLKENLVEPHRILVQEGDFLRVNAAQNKSPAKVFLFNDIAVLGFQSLDFKFVKSSATVQFLDYRIIPLADAAVKVDETDRSKIILTYEGDEQDKSYTLQLHPGRANQLKRDDWIAAVNQQVEGAKSMPPSVLTQRLRSTSYFSLRGVLVVFALLALAIGVVLPYIGMAVGFTFYLERHGVPRSTILKVLTAFTVLIFIMGAAVIRLSQRRERIRVAKARLRRFIN
jgi:hypothetical protein